MKTLLIGASMLMVISDAHAASISAQIVPATPTPFAFAWITGKINPGDDEEFATLLAAYPPRTYVYLDSPGGNVDAGLRIAYTIRAKGFDTVVQKKNICASICGVIWLAGSMRYVSEKAHIGFHSAYNVKSGERSIEGNGAIAGNLRFFGYSYEAITYLTQAPPEGMAWLQSKKAIELGITAIIFPCGPDCPR